MMTRPTWTTLAAARPDPRALWRSPLRGPWLTSVFGAVLLAALPVVVITGLLDYIAYGPQFGQAFPTAVGPLHLPYFDWPTRPSWLFRLTEGLHVGLGLVLVPVILAKLWSVVPRLFSWPPVRSPWHALERLSLVPLVGGILFEVVTGVLNIQYDYVFGFDFYTAHYFGAWVFVAGFVVHVLVKLPTMVRSLRGRSLRAQLRVPLADTRTEEALPGDLGGRGSGGLGPGGLVPDRPVSGSPVSESPVPGSPVSGGLVSGSPVSGSPVPGSPVPGSPVSGGLVPDGPVSGGLVPDGPVSDSLVPDHPGAPTLSRRGLFGLVGGGSLMVAALTVGQTVDALRPTAFLLPRGRTVDDGPTGFPINRTAQAAGVTAADLADWRLSLAGGPGPVSLDLAALAALPQHTARLPIACVEGWSTTQTWTGVRLRDLAALAGVAAPSSARVTSLERAGAFSSAWLTGGQVLDPDALLATSVNGVPLSPDHGYPARVIVPALPGVHCTKWVGTIDFRRP